MTPDREEALRLARELLKCGPDEAEWKWDDRKLARALLALAADLGSRRAGAGHGT